jgi:amino acid adenylation domain-containing protein
MVANMEQRVGVLPMLAESEQQLLLREWNRTALHEAERAWRSVPELFAAQVQRQPRAIAVAHGKEALSYAELDERANRLACYLKKLGVGAETLVGLCIGRGIEQVIGALGVLKSGGAYLPLDPAYPVERRAFMIEDSALKVLVTRRSLVEGLALKDVQVIFLDQDSPDGVRDNAVERACEVTAENLAYVIYTSGSTGRPRGVALTHGGLANLVEAQASAFGVEPDERVLQFASFSFDASVSEIFVTLARGATLVLGEPESLLPGAGLAEFLETQAVTMVTLPPSALANMRAAELPMLKRLVAAGEPLSAGLLERWSRNERQFFNAYGPTETTVCATIGLCDAGVEASAIGRPIAQMETYILGPDLQAVPINVPGELYIGGAGLARCYINLPALTAEKFIPDPFSGRAGARLYRTGDEARYRSGGSIEFIGRRDRQIKLRGFRIELGEIEAVLGRHPSVIEAAVLAREDAPQEKRLVAYVVAVKDNRPEAHALLSFLREYLPDYMAPRAYVFLDALPRTPAGKIDRAALPPPDDARPDTGAAYVAPASELENQIAAIWREALHLERVGVNDNFFDLGGHSLLLAQVQGKLESALARSVPLRLLFTHPTIRALADGLSGNEAEEGFSAETSQERADLRRASRMKRRDIRRATQAASSMNGAFDERVG